MVGPVVAHLTSLSHHRTHVYPQNPHSPSLAGLHVAYAAFEPLPNHKGSGTRITQMVRALVHAGARVTLLSLASKQANPAAALLQLPGLIHRPLPIAEPNLLARALKFRDAVAQALEALQPDVVHFRGIFEGRACLDHAYHRGIPSIFEAHGLPSIELAYHYPALADAPALLGKLRRQEADCLARADQVITQSQHTLAFLQAHGRGARPAHVIPNGADPQRFAPQLGPRALAPSSGPQPLQVLYVGTLTAWQGLGELLAATARARKALRQRGDQTTDLHLKVVGPGRRGWLKALARRAQRLGLTEALTIQDPTDHGELPALVQSAQLCVAPLRDDPRNRHQGCSPIKVFEYMAAGKATIVSDLPCVREICSERTSRLVRPGHPKDLADTLLDLAHDPEQRARLGSAARQYVLDTATWDHRHLALQTLYGVLLDRARAAR